MNEEDTTNISEAELIDGQVGNILFDAKEGDLINIPNRINTIILLARAQGRKDAIEIIDKCREGLLTTKQANILIRKIEKDSEEK